MNNIRYGVTTISHGTFIKFWAEKKEAVSSASVLAFVGFSPYHHIIIT